MMRRTRHHPGGPQGRPVGASPLTAVRAISGTGLWLGPVVLVAFQVQSDALLAQAIPFSQHGTVTQRVGITDIAIAYNRPTARGRLLFPGVVAWGKPWTPGADSATRIWFSRDVVIEDQIVAAGEYSIWLIPREAGPWSLILHRNARTFHLPYPGEAGEAMRVSIIPTSGDHMDALALYFPIVARDSTILRVHWGSTILPIRIRARAVE